LLLEQYYLTAAAIAKSAFADKVNDIGQLAEFVAGALEQSKIGTVVTERERLFVRYRGCAIGLSPGSGVETLDFHDFEHVSSQAEVKQQLPDDVAMGVREFVQANPLISGLSCPAVRSPFADEPVD
jgi:hypothetical protein